MTLEKCTRLLRNGDGFTGFARINGDSTWTIEFIEVRIQGRSHQQIRHLLSNLEARIAIPFLQDMIDSAKTEANYGGKL